MQNNALVFSKMKDLAISGAGIRFPAANDRRKKCYHLFKEVCWEWSQLISTMQVKTGNSNKALGIELAEI